MAMRVSRVFLMAALLGLFGESFVNAAEAPGINLRQWIKMSPPKKRFGKSEAPKAVIKIKNRSSDSLLGPFSLVVTANSAVTLEGASQNRDGQWVIPLGDANTELASKAKLPVPRLRFSNPLRNRFTASYALYGLRGPNQLPVAYAGQDRSVQIGDSVIFDAAGSQDSEGTLLTYRWTIVERPSGSTAALLNPDSANSAFTPDAAGSYRVQLVINDGITDSAPVYVTLSALSPPPPEVPVPSITALTVDTDDKTDWVTGDYKPTISGSVATGAINVQILTAAEPGQENPPGAPAPGTAKVANDGTWSYHFPDLDNGQYVINTFGVAGDGRISKPSPDRRLVINSTGGDSTPGSRGINETDIAAVPPGDPNDPSKIYIRNEGGPLIRINPPSGAGEIAEVEVHLRHSKYQFGPESSNPEIELSDFVVSPPIVFPYSELLKFDFDDCGVSSAYPNKLECSELVDPADPLSATQPLPGNYYGLHVRKLLVPGSYEVSLRVRYDSGQRSRTPFDPSFLLTINPNTARNIDGKSLFIESLQGTAFVDNTILETSEKTPVISGYYGPVDKQRFSISLYRLDTEGNRQEIGTFSAQNNPSDQLNLFGLSSWELSPASDLAVGTYLVVARYRYDNALATTSRTFKVVAPESAQ